MVSIKSMSITRGRIDLIVLDGLLLRACFTWRAL
jgi:hypothetical protein